MASGNVWKLRSAALQKTQTLTQNSLPVTIGNDYHWYTSPLRNVRDGYALLHRRPGTRQ